MPYAPTREADEGVEIEMEASIDVEDAEKRLQTQGVGIIVNVDGYDQINDFGGVIRHSSNFLHRNQSWTTGGHTFPTHIKDPALA